VAAEFDKLNRQVSKMQDSGKTPKPYIRIIAELEDSMNEALAKQKVTPKKMNATQFRALNAVKQKIKKTNKEYQTQIGGGRACSGTQEVKQASAGSVLYRRAGW
jgi:translation initiation factor 3 subunit C